jgi:hypothetical protein
MRGSLRSLGVTCIYVLSEKSSTRRFRASHRDLTAGSSYGHGHGAMAMNQRPAAGLLASGSVRYDADMLMIMYNRRIQWGPRH